MKLRHIEILENESNKKGDLFGRLMGDLFHTLGYGEPRLNIHKSGREIDLQAFHRTENKIAIAECKAHTESIGGDDINKFVGIIDAEKRKLIKEFKKFDVVGYFISLSGFKETAIEQENEADNQRVILIKPDKIVEELIKGRVIVSIEKAISSLVDIKDDLTLIDYVDLLAFSKGWIWVIYYSNSDGQNVSHFALVHAEGKPLVKNLAEEIFVIDNNINKLFDGLVLLNQKESTTATQYSLKETQNKYFKYLENELGDIQFEGLPTDKEAGSVKVKLENIFVPLHLTKIQSHGKEESDTEKETREGIGEILEKNTRLAILAKPGGGKSTLIKRIAIAYAFPSRRKEINDKLPDKPWFPIFLRSRELGDKIMLSITEIINGIPFRAEISPCANDFSNLVSRSLQNGNALLLIDGLDEIAEDKNRIAFVNQLRTFIATYPTINIIVTSREAGFRVVGGSLATYCEHYKVSNLIESEIEELVIKWHKAIIDDSENTIKEATKIGEIIIKDSRIKVLAENPLLLTTLLFVKRWAGYLPTKRSVLYQEMIKLLLVTWNVEGHKQLDIEEAEPQLAFVAYWMTKNSQQTISEENLNNCLVDARKQMPEILGYTSISPSEFIKRVESRSSLLIMSGHKRLESGNITQVYEFLHLSFQEYLTAKAIVKGFIPQSDTDKKKIDLIKPNVNNENWKEVIPIVAVLLEREAKDLIEYLISASKTIAIRNVSSEEKEKEKRSEVSLIPSLLGNCLANEIQINPDLLGEAIEWYAKNKNRDIGTLEIILNNKFGQTFRKRLKYCFFEKYDDKFAAVLGSTLSEMFVIDLESPEDISSIQNGILTALKSKAKEEKCVAILGLMKLVFRSRDKKIMIESSKETEDIFIILLELLKTNDNHYHFSICWCIAWVMERKIFPNNLIQPYIDYLIEPWTIITEYNLKRVTSWVLCKLLSPFVLKDKIIKIEKLSDIVNKTYHNPANEFDKLVAVYLGYILEIKYDSTELMELFKYELNRGQHSISYYQFAKALNINLEELKQK